MQLDNLINQFSKLELIPDLNNQDNKKTSFGGWISLLALGSQDILIPP
jgi:hypothetical protein